MWSATKTPSSISTRRVCILSWSSLRTATCRYKIQVTQKKIDVHIKSRTKFKEAEIWAVASDLLSGAKFLHQNKILHRDIKAANIFFNEGVAKLGDMNVSRVLKDQNFAKTQTGTPYYTSPEIWQGKAYGPKCDIWSIGCVIYEMAALRPPFTAQSY